MNVEGKTVVLTGATGGIGAALARRLDADGARLILVARNATKLAELLAELGADRHRAVAADLCTAPGRARVVETCRNVGAGGVHVLINAAGINEFEFFEAQSADAIRQLIDINLVSPILLSHELLPILRRQVSAQIVNIGSTFGSIGFPGFGAYCASKFGLRGFSEALRRELDGSTVRVCYVAPRATRTALNSAAVVEMNAALGTAMDEPTLVADAVLRSIRAAGPDRYLGWPEKLFVRINALFPQIVDSSLRRQLPLIRRFAAQKP